VPLRKRISLVAASAVAVAVALAAMGCYLVVRNQLLGQVDNALKNEASAVEQSNGQVLEQRRYLPTVAPGAGGPTQYWQLVYSNGSITYPTDGLQLPVNHQTQAAAEGQTDAPFFEDANVDGSHVRMLILPGQGFAVELADSLTGTDSVLSSLRLILCVLLLLGMALAAALGRLAANRVLAPLAEVTETAQLIGETDDLSQRLVVRDNDEVGQLALRFNEMLDHIESSRAALDESVRAQRQLVADASHELRTPVTSLRTNIEVLLAGGTLDEDDRRRLLADVVEQSEELSALVSDLIELARGDLPPGGTEDVRLDRVVEESIARARRNAPDVRITAQLAPVTVEGVGERIARAVNNLLDNAARHTDPGTDVEVVVDDAGVRVRDHGPGIADEDLPYVFDRFYRGAGSRGRQGSGLGLAIVRQVAVQHGGTVTAANAPDGGAVFTLSLPTTITGEARDGELAVTPPYGAGGLATRA
jgi:two-component system, OmpR family, sensor histidine kinase MprB